MARVELPQMIAAGAMALAQMHEAKVELEAARKVIDACRFLMNGVEPPPQPMSGEEFHQFSLERLVFNLCNVVDTVKAYDAVIGGK